MALVDVSRTITLFQRLCQFAEEFTEEHLDAMVAALMNLFRADLQEEGREPPDVLGLIKSLLLRLRLTLANMTLAETILLGAFKANIEFRSNRDRIVSELRVDFDHGRVETRNHFGRAKADAAGFPARISDDPGALLRQTKLVSWTFRQPDFDLGEPVIAGSTVTAETILAMYEPKVEELETALSGAVRRKARTRGKQVAKDKEVKDFRTTYSIFVGLIRGAFRLAGEPELADRLTLAQIQRSATAPRSGTPTPADPPLEGEPQPATPQPATPQPATPQPATPQPAVPQPAAPQPGVLPAVAPAPGEEEPGQPG